MQVTVACLHPGSFSVSLSFFSTLLCINLSDFSPLTTLNWKKRYPWQPKGFRVKNPSSSNRFWRWKSSSIVGEKSVVCQEEGPIKTVEAWSCQKETRSCLFNHESKNESEAPSFTPKPFRMSSSPSETVPHITSENILHFCQSVRAWKSSTPPPFILCYQTSVCYFRD